MKRFVLFAFAMAVLAVPAVSQAGTGGTPAKTCQRLDAFKTCYATKGQQFVARNTLTAPTPTFGIVRHVFRVEVKLKGVDGDPWGTVDELYRAWTPGASAVRSRLEIREPQWRIKQLSKGYHIRLAAYGPFDLGEEPGPDQPGHIVPLN